MNILLLNEVNGSRGFGGLLFYFEFSFKILLEFVICNCLIFMIFVYFFIFKKGLSIVGVYMIWCIFIYYYVVVDVKLSIFFELCFCIKL